nr:phage repressor protein CI [Erwinia sp. Ejp617]
MPAPNDNPKRMTRFNFLSQCGGKAAITRILQAYGLTTRQALCDHLGVSQSTMANRWMRDNFPHDWLIACHLDTGASLLWLTTGEGQAFSSAGTSSALTLQCHEITNGAYTSSDWVSYDARLIPHQSASLLLVKFEQSIYLVDELTGEINDGRWLIEIDGFKSIKNVYRLPGDRIRVENGPASFECHATEIAVHGKVIGKTEFTE